MDGPAVDIEATQGCQAPLPNPAPAPATTGAHLWHEAAVAGGQRGRRRLRHGAAVGRRHRGKVGGQGGGAELGLGVPAWNWQKTWWDKGGGQGVGGERGQVHFTTNTKHYETASPSTTSTNHHRDTS